MRKLATAAFSFAAAVLLCIYLLPVSWRLLAAVACAVLAVCGLFLKGKTRIILPIIGISLAAGMLWSTAYDTLIRFPADRLDGRTETTVGTVTGFPDDRDYGWRVNVRIPLERGFSAKTTLYIYDDSAAGLRPGDVITFTARFSSADEIFGEETESYRSKGVFLTAQVQGNVSVNANTGHFWYFPSYIGHVLREKIKAIFPDDTENFIRALLLGDKTLSDEEPVLAMSMKEAGIYHVAAVSGMHVVFLASLITVLFGKKWWGTLFAAAFTLLFAAVTGFAPSVVRAEIMLLCVLLAPLIRREYDPLTALSFALLLILLQNPYAVAGYGLQLSFAATLGMILFNGRVFKALELRRDRKKKRWPGPLRKAYRYAIATVAATVGASVFTVPLTALYFDYMSVVAPLTNLLLLWLIEAIFCAGIVACLLAFLYTPIGTAAAYLISYPVRGVLLVIRALASLPFASIYTTNIGAVLWIIFLYLLLLTVLRFKEGKRRLIIPGAAAVVSLCVLLIASPAAESHSELTVAILDVGQGQCIVITAGSSTAVIDCGSSSGEDAGSIAAGYLKSRGRSTVDLLILTHFHDDHANGVKELFGSVNIRAIAMPDPTLSEGSLAGDIIRVAEASGAGIIYITRDIRVHLSDAELVLYEPVGSSGENERCASVLCSENGNDALITGDMSAELERLLLMTERLPDIELLVVGHHGSKTSTCEDLLAAVTPEIAVISVGENAYGHPTEEVLERLAAWGIEVYRTDMAGTVQIRMG